MFATMASSSGHSDTLDPIIRSAGLAATDLRFARLPVEKSSIMLTEYPSLNRRSTRCEPIKPAPPVTKTRPRVVILFTRSSEFFHRHLVQSVGDRFSQLLPKRGV